MKFNKKGQGALEYLLLIGGAVLIAVIVIALLVGMGSENATTARDRNKEALEAIDTPIPSTISNVTCNTDGNAIVSWTPVVKDNYTFKISENGVDVTPVAPATFTSTTNPVVVGTNCYPGAIYIITTISTTTTNGVTTTKSATSNTYTVN